MSDDITSEAQTIAVGQLRAFIERIERLEEEKENHRRRYQGSLRGAQRFRLRFRRGAHDHSPSQEGGPRASGGRSDASTLYGRLGNELTRCPTRKTSA